MKPLDILEILSGYPFLREYVLSLYYEKDGAVSRVGAASPLCGGLARHLVCSDRCEAAYEKAVRLALSRKRPMVFSCRADLMNFAVPYQPGDGLRYCFVGGGVRNRTIDVFLAEKLAKSDRTDGFALLGKLEEIPSATPEGVKDVAREIFRLLAALDPDSLQARFIEKNMERFGTIRGILTQVECAASEEDLVDLLGDTVGILFDVPRVAVGIRDSRGDDIQLRGIPGMPRDLGVLKEGRVSALFPDGAEGKALVTERELGEFFPSVVAERAVCLPISTGGEILGILALFDTDLTHRETMLVGMVTDRIADRIAQLRREEAHRFESSLSGRFVSLLSTLSSVENRRDLYISILRMAAELLRASSGSLMLIDESGRYLRIESVLGMNLQLARSLNSRVGRGIAGKVAQSGEPLLVGDIENDARVRIPNRSRFRTKSFVSLPLLVKGEVIGVLNLADKVDGGVFTETDLDLVMKLAQHACVVLERTESSEKAARLEELTVTDPLTGLFNRRFLEQRLEEELSRGDRQAREITILLVDLDNFKVYNELCGHAAGDVVLKKSACLLKNSARQMDIVTRYGGERFCVILPSTPKKESLVVAERFRREVERSGFAHEENLPLGRLTVSIGIATFPDNGRDVKSLIGSAELAVHRAKLSGRNRVEHFDSATASDIRQAPALRTPPAEAGA